MRKTTHRKAQRRTLRWAQGSTCAGCGKHLPSATKVKKNHPDYPTFDHVIPRSRGGKNVLTNGILKHRFCNALRANRLPTGCDLIWLAFVQARLAVRPIGPALLTGFWPVRAKRQRRGLSRPANGQSAAATLAR